MGKIFLSVALFGVSLCAFADVNIIEQCKTTIVAPDKSASVDMKIDIVMSDILLASRIYQKIAGTESVYSDNVYISWDSVRPGLTPDAKESLNTAEALIVHAMAMENEPVFKGHFSSGLDLTAVRWARMYRVGKQTRMG